MQQAKIRTDSRIAKNNTPSAAVLIGKECFMTQQNKEKGSFWLSKKKNMKILRRRHQFLETSDPPFYKT